MADSESARTCVGCNVVDAREALLRVVLDGDPPMLAPDIRRRAGGRGASVHPRRACLDAALRRGGFRRAFRCELSASSADALVRAAHMQYERRIDGLLLAARRTRRLAVGTESVRQAIESGSAALLLVAADAGTVGEKLAGAAQRADVAVATLGTKDRFGRLLGRDTVAVVAVTDTRISNELQMAVENAARLAEES